MHMLVRAWDQVMAATIADCFRHCGFAAGVVQGSGNDGAEELVPAALRDVHYDVTFSDYVEVDSGASVRGALTDEDIIAEVGGKQSVVEEMKKMTTRRRWCPCISRLRRSWKH